jgi:3-polyprenyl-4-hydroxybenzoate decarboxylase
MAKREERVVETERGKKTVPIQDLRDWLERVDRLGDLIRIKEPVDCEEEMSAISYLVAKQNPSPAILFDTV